VTSSSGMALSLGLVCAAACGPAHARQQLPPPAAEGIFLGDRGFAQGLMTALQEGDLGGAFALLEARPEIAETPAGVRLHAELLNRLGRTTEAIRLLEGHLTRSGHDAVARFQVGEIQFAARRDRAATLAYRLALAGDLDFQRRQIVKTRLGAIEARRDLRISLSGAIAPDSNINNATSASTIDLFGLPFALSDDARRRSGVAASIGGTVERRLAISPRYALRVGASAAFLDTSNRQFDQSQVGLFAGPDVQLGRYARLSLAATYRDIDFGGADLETWRGLLANGEAYADSRTRWDGSAHLDRIHSQRSAAWSGWFYGTQASRTRFLGPSALWRASLAFDIHDLAEPESDYREVQVMAGRLFALPLSSLGYIEPYGRERAFDQRSSVFGVRRLDRELGVNVRISKRDWSYRGAFPYVQAIISRSSSNVTLGRYSRQRIEFGFTREF